MISRSSKVLREGLLHSGRTLWLTPKLFFSTSATGRLFPERYNVIYDSKCALCRIEIDWLQRKNEGGKLRFTDLERDYDELDPKNAGVTYRAAMEAMTIVDGKTGKVSNGIDVFYLIYDTLGLGWVWSFTKLPLVGPFANDVYKFWALYRTNVTRGKSIDTLVQEYADYQRLKECNENCKV